MRQPQEKLGSLGLFACKEKKGRRRVEKNDTGTHSIITNKQDQRNSKGKKEKKRNKEITGIKYDVGDSNERLNK